MQKAIINNCIVEPAFAKQVLVKLSVTLPHSAEPLTVTARGPLHEMCIAFHSIPMNGTFKANHLKGPECIIYNENESRMFFGMAGRY